MPAQTLSATVRSRQGCTARRFVAHLLYGHAAIGRGGLAGAGRPDGSGGLGPALAGTPKQGGDPVDDSSTCPWEVASS